MTIPAAYLDAAMRAIERAANNGRPAPTNRIISDMLGLISTASASRIVSALEDQGHIRVERFSASRRIVICATGKATQVSGKKRTRDVYPPRRPRAKPVVEPKSPILIARRDPCPRCGVRGDVGCGHGWQP